MALDHPAIQNGANALAVTAPIVSIWSNAPEVVTVVVGLLGIIWYSIIIVEKVMSWFDKQSLHDPLEANEPPPSDMNHHHK